MLTLVVALSAAIGQNARQNGSTWRKGGSKGGGRCSSGRGFDCVRGRNCLRFGSSAAARYARRGHA
eukprot:675359-Prymnesium_polylepis.1